MEVYRAQLTRVISGPVKLTDQDPLQRSNRINQSAMEEPTAKGTVTSLSSMFSVDDVQKAAKRVQDALLEKQQELERVKEFISDNTNLINLVQKLPEELHHAFFPGRLIHTNEFMVLLGEGYYAERTSKQTVEILKRRGKVLDSQVDSLKAMMKDLQAEASFFDTTASEAAEGLVEIREEYGEENLSERASESGLLKQDSSRLSEADNLKDEDEEYARIMSRLDELEKEELAWEIENGSAESKQNNVAKSDNAKYGDEDNELEEAELAAETENRSDENKQNNAAGSDNENNEDEQANTVSDQFSNQISLDHNLRHSECTGLTVQAALEDAKPRTKSLATNVNVEANSAEKALVLPKEDNVATAPLSIQEISAQASKPEFDRYKAFTESIIEHNYNLQTDQQEQIRNTSKPSGSQSSKPVSRFKMQRK
ncbi:prefoldin chaperone subunit family protein [Citrus sinensis]|uniref:Prefoldin chaperone subunit family protein n=1 Tax=Citrus sinensis TaxID=2711 RepID=A0ACB8N3B4_CITSI|nr:prefoldin chaperone subunit family protein [Citrus sinensis]